MRSALPAAPVWGGAAEPDAALAYLGPAMVEVIAGTDLI